MATIWTETAPIDDSPRLPGLDLPDIDLSELEVDLEPELDFVREFDATDDIYDSDILDDDDDAVISEFAPISRFVNE